MRAKLVLNFHCPCHCFMTLFAGLTNQTQVSSGGLRFPGFAHGSECVGKRRLSFLLILGEHRPPQARRLVPKLRDARRDTPLPAPAAHQG